MAMAIIDFLKIIEITEESAADLVAAMDALGMEYLDFGDTEAMDNLIALILPVSAEDAMAWMLEVMRTPPEWAATIPLDAEGGYAREYSK